MHQSPASSDIALIDWKGDRLAGLLNCTCGIIITPENQCSRGVGVYGDQKGVRGGSTPFILLGTLFPTKQSPGAFWPFGAATEVA